MLDALVTMISFLMFTMAFLSFTMIESPIPMVSSQENEAKLKEPPLQLTLTIKDSEVTLWSPFDHIQPVSIPNKPEGGIDLLKMHEALVGIKQKFPHENQIAFVPKGGTTYDDIVQILDSVRNFDKTDPPVAVLNEKTGVSEQAKQLFGDVIFANLLGGEE